MDDSGTSQLETAHVLFLDIVGFSAIAGTAAEPKIDVQRRLIAELQDLVRGLAEVEGSVGRGDALRIPTGDGMALVFFRDPLAPVRSAMELSRALRSRSHLKLRMGLHSGPVYRVQDVNSRANVSGGGINLAQRVMDCGDAGHILLSRQFVDQLNQIGAWPLQELGECEVKHGERVHLFNLFTSDAGNPALPERFRSALPASPWAAGASSGATGSGTRVALLYKRNVQPDGHLLELLDASLREAGCRVFVDRNLAVGVDWAREIERQVAESDVVVALLSAASIQSEMLEWELEHAHRCAQENGGRPRILPVRIELEGRLPDPLGSILDPLEYALWSGSEDDAGLAQAILDAIGKPSSSGSAAVPREALEAVGGAVPLDSQFYVVRAADAEFRAAIARQDSIVLLKGARQMGKTSLLARGLQQARQQGARVVRTDFQKLNAQHLESADALFLKLAESIADQLELDIDPETVWQARRGPSQNFERFWRRQVLRTIPEPMAWGLDEVDRLFSCDFASEVFGLFRSWHNERALDPEGPWRRLTLAIAYATEAHLFITDVNQSPFNVGTRLTLEDFSLEQIGDLNRKYGSPLRSEAELARFARLVGGHPYLVRRGLHELAANALTLERFEAQADRDEGIFGDHLRRILVLLARDPELCSVVTGILGSKPCPSAESFYRLRSAGVMAGESSKDVHPRCRLYETYLSRHLL